LCESAVYSRVSSSRERKLHHQTTGSVETEPFCCRMQSMEK
jgi:hypothetical protein